MENIIKINIKKKEDYVSKFNDDILSRELSNYIIDEYKSFSIKDKFHIEVTSDYEMDEREKDNFVDMLRYNYGTEISEMISKRKRSVFMDIITLLLAGIALVFYLFSSDVPILSEFILVFSWVLIWESMYNLIFGGFANKIDIERRRKITECKVLFK